MEAFLDIQKQVYQLSALQRKGVANARYLSEDEKRVLDFSVIVKDGSSLFELNINDMMKDFIEKACDKMSGTQMTIIVVAVALLFTAGWSYKTYLSHKKAVKLEEIKSDEHKDTLNTLVSAVESDEKKYEILADIVRQNGELGYKAVEMTEKSFDALVKATAKTPEETIINSVKLKRDQARVLCTSTRVRSEEEPLILRVKVIDINTQDLNMILLVIRDIESDNVYKLQFKERLLQDMAGEDGENQREKIFKALQSRAVITVELRAKVHEDDIRSVEFVKVIEE